MQKSSWKLVFAVYAVIAVLGAATPVLCGQEAATHVLRATTYNSHFPAAAEGGEAWNGISVASNGMVYYVLSSPVYNVPAQMYSFNPKTKMVTHIASLNDAVGQGNAKEVVQGKSHVSFVEDHGKLYFSTHLGYYAHAAGIETTAPAPDGYGPYPGGHFVSYDLKTGKFENLAIAPRGEGIITFAMDVQRGRLYGITWPTGHFLRYDLKTKELKDLGTRFHGGETGILGDTYRSICRRIVIDPRDGSAYFTTGEGTIYRYSYGTDTIAAVKGVDLKKDYFGQFNPSQHGMAYNWRAAIWDPSENAIYGVNGRSGYLFRFDPKVPSVEVIDRLTSIPSKKSGMFDKFDYGYLGLVLGADGHTLYYLTGSPLPASKGTAPTKRHGEGAHLITYDISAGKYVDHGQIILDNGDPATAPQSLAVAPDGTVYTLCYVVRNGKKGIELISFHP
ncbi:MAG TPA: hypothetical protein VFE38_06505 [Edaphobacter sp.]|nr:hypothetical protein [Edaphobacter sp.]